MEGTLNPLPEREREVLRQASVVLGGRVVVLWEVSAHAEVVPVVTSVLNPPHHATTLDLDETLRHWGVPIIQGSRWVGNRLDDAGRWCVAPVREQPAAPPPSGVERRSRERLTLELAGLCLGLLERTAGLTKARQPEPEALLELARHPSVIAHEVANPLTASVVALDSCIDAVQGAGEVAPALRAQLLEDLAEVGQGMEQAIDYLRAIQDRSRGALARSERFDAVQVVRSCITLERPLARKRGVALQWDTAVDSVYLQGDPNALYQMLTNLLHNSVDASQGHGWAVAVSLERVGATLRLAVRDQGMGIASEHLERIFEPGFTTKPFGASSGMGLPIVREVTRNMFGGMVTVESRVGEGSVFTVTLPIPAQRPK